MLFEEAGNLKEISKTKNGIRGTTENSFFRITLYRPGIIKVHFSRDENFNEHSYAVIAEPEKVNFKVNETKRTIRCNTGLLEVEIIKTPFRLRFLNTAGKVINEDEPGLGTGWLGDTVTVHKKLQPNERFIGLGEKTGGLNRAGSAYIHNNTDAFAYGNGTDPIYSTIPFYIGLHSKLAYGVFIDSSFRSYINFGASTDRFSSFAADGGDMEYYIFYDNSVAGIIQSYTWLTGRMKLPPLWSLGYQQARYSYYPESEVMSIADSFREKQIPADAMVFDIHYMDQYKIFTWDKDRFPDPPAMIKKLKKKGFNSVVILDPGIKKEKGYQPYEEGVKEDVFVKYPDGTNYTGQVWPGWCHFPDFTRPATRKWWKKYFRELVKTGITGFWNDMNEIATWGHALPESIVFDFEGNPTSARQARNVYGLMMSKSTHEAALDKMKGQRPFTLTRSAYAGIQRYAAVWTGDNTANDEHMLLGVRLVNSLGLSGVAFAGYDVGGFIGDASVGLYARWISIGAFSPFFRGHTMINSRSSEPWSYGEEVEDIARNYIGFRYRLLPYIYSTFYEASQTGLPVSRSLAISHSHEEEVYQPGFENQYYFGPSIMVCPVSSGDHLARVYLPEGTWYDLYNGTRITGKGELLCESPPHRLPVFVKGSSIIPLQNVVQHTGEKPDEVLELHVYDGPDQNTFVYYEDDGSSHDYEEGVFYRRVMNYDGSKNKLTLSKAEGKFATRFRDYRFVFHGLQKDQVAVNGRKQPAKEEQISLFEALSHFDPVQPPAPPETETVRTIKIRITKKEITLSW